MDLSKTTLQDLDNRKSEKLFSENQNQDNFFIDSSNRISHESIKDAHGTNDLGNDFNSESHYHQKESRNETQNAIHLKYKQLEHRDMQNRYSRNSTTSATNVDVSSSMNDFSNLEKNDVNYLNYEFSNITNVDGQHEQANTSNIFKNQSSICLNSNINDTITAEEQLSNTLTNTDETASLHQINNDDIQKSTPKELKKEEVTEDGKTMEQITEMITKSSENTNENNPKLKKRLHILMSRNCTEKHLNSCEKSISNILNDPNISQIKRKDDVTDHNTTNKSLTSSTNKKIKYTTDTSGSQNNITPSEYVESEENCLVKSRFEEIEDKLEEMFAGIEDEQLLTTTDDTHLSKKIEHSTDKYINVNCNNNASNGKEFFVDNSFKYEKFTSNKSTYPTKGAKKTSTSLLNIENNKQEISLLSDQKDSKISKSILYLKTMPPRRRLSIAMNSDLLKFSVSASDEINKDKTANIDLNRKKGMTSNIYESETNKEVKNLRKDVNKSKTKNNQKSGSKYKKEITYIKSNNRNNKKKPEVSNKSKQSRQKIKQRRMQRLLSSENDNVMEERALQTKDIDTKHRSPFILVKSNGSITVVNTVTADDSNEKWTRSKKNCIYERKTVKGCHSSTLSNRYDADTADSTWICVFCKIGPHKKGLGDLFGPYIISTDCDEYQCNKISTEKQNKQQHINFSKNTVKYNNEMLIPNVQHIYGFNQEQTSSSSMLGMSQISDNCYEIWIHEECAIWSPNIFVVGSRLAGLEDATWSSMRYECAYCLKQGALLCCLQRDCKTTSHIPCAREFNWLLDESRFWAYCSKHVINKF